MLLYIFLPLSFEASVGFSKSLEVAVTFTLCGLVIYKVHYCYSKQHTEAFDFIVISLKSASLIQVINGLIQQFFVEKHCHGRKRAKSGCTCTGSREKIEFFKDILRRSLWVSNHRFKSRYFYKTLSLMNTFYRKVSIQICIL